jgi:hypothetical protein
MLPVFPACLLHHAGLLPWVLLPVASPCLILPSLSRQTRQSPQVGKAVTQEVRQANEQKDRWMGWWLDVWIDEWKE